MYFYYQVWKLPERWISEDVQKFEETEIKIQKDTAAMLNIQRQQTKRDEDEDSEDDLNGWDFKQMLLDNKIILCL